MAIGALRGVRIVAGASIFMALSFLAYWVLSPGPCDYEAAAIAGLRALNSAQTEYEQTHPETGYASTLVELREAEVIDEALATGLDHDYRFTLKADPPRSSGRILTYTALADPAFRPRGTCRGFFTNEIGTIHFTLEDRPATVEDPLLQ